LRAFLAVPVTPPALDEGARLLDELRLALPDVRWVRREGLHITLHFWERLQDDEVSRVVDAVRAPVAQVAGFDAQLGGLGSFPRDGDERVLWMGMSRGEAEMAGLQEQSERALQAAGFEREPRAFRPHVTLGRPRQRLSASRLGLWRSHAGVALPPFAVGEVCLYRSHSGPGGSRYEVLDRVGLGVSASR
jgi:2'-5' RNA ligase